MKMVNSYIFSFLTTLLFKEVVYGVIADSQQIIQSSCRGLSGGSFPHPFDCAKFIECDRGASVIKTCGPGNVYNPEIRLCDWPYNVPGCSGASGSGNNLQEDVTSPQPSSQSGHEFTNTLIYITPKPSQEPQWNNNQNHQSVNNEHQSAEYGQNYLPVQNENENSGRGPNPLSIGNGESTNTLIQGPATPSQPQYLIFNKGRKPAGHGENYRVFQGGNQYNGYKAHESQQKENYPKPQPIPFTNGNGDESKKKAIYGQPTQDQLQWSNSQNNQFTSNGHQNGQSGLPIQNGYYNNKQHPESQSLVGWGSNKNYQSIANLFNDKQNIKPLFQEAKDDEEYGNHIDIRIEGKHSKI